MNTCSIAMRRPPAARQQPRRVEPIDDDAPDSRLTSVLLLLLCLVLAAGAGMSALIVRLVRATVHGALFVFFLGRELLRALFTDPTKR